MKIKALARFQVPVMDLGRTGKKFVRLHNDGLPGARKIIITRTI